MQLDFVTTKKKLLRRTWFLRWVFIKYVNYTVQIRSFFWSVFSRIQSEYKKIRTRKNSVFGHVSRSVKNEKKNDRSSRPEFSIKKVVLKVSAIHSLQIYLRNLRYRCFLFPLSLLKFLRTLISNNTGEQLILKQVF